ncbi:BTAD domain-containing putative transcriptional regulator [Streptomyces sp. NPDC048172]|uniref:BTAD domain-containing putative transcriptional regulator n=1 Tax=Streptomyces sp. NPDC048172 TaxID=3365505 RepID=UPI0037124E15
MGRREKPITTSNRALAELAQWLRDQRTARRPVLTYAQLAARTGLHATTLQRAASGASVPTAAVVTAFAQACGVPPEIALQLRTRARQEALRADGDGQEAPTPEAVKDPPELSAALQGLHAEAGGPTMREMERRAGGYGKLPHNTAHRILRGKTVPRDEQQFLAFLDACDVAPRERQRWVDAWRRVSGATTGTAGTAGTADVAGTPGSAGTPSPEWETRPGSQTRIAIPVPLPQPPVPPPRSREARLRFSVLGPVRVWHGDRALLTGSPQQRALLAALLLRDGRTATAEELIDAIWGEDPPDRAKAALRTYASRIRKSLGPDADLLASESGGYALRLTGDESVDLHNAQGLATYAEKAETLGDRLRARDLYDSALAEWDGEPLAHVPGPYAETHRIRLEEWRLDLLEHRLDLDLQTGDHAQAASELTALTAAHPLRERLRELLMLALYRSGRQAEALAVYADTRRLLADELGVDPRPELSELQQRILEADEELAYSADPAPEPAAPAVMRPAQLPATIADFTGRVSFIRELGDQLAAADGTAMVVSAVAGIGGVGKTTLAVHVAHAARDRFPDGQLYVDLQGAGSSPADPEAVLGAFLRALGTPDAAIPDGPVERAALYRSLLADRRVLVVLDNARDASQVRPLLPSTAGCAALVTSRVRMVDLAVAHLVDLDVMSPDEAMALFTRIVGEERVGAEREAAMDVVAACGFLPLAIRIAAARLASRRTWTVSVLATKLADERRRLDELQAGDQAVRATFELGYGQLDTEQARAFRLLGRTRGRDIPLHAAAGLLDRSLEETEDILESLVDTSLLESAGPGRYRLHNLVRLTARTRLSGQEPGSSP